jgi:membrane associated rhomboid family serine protease
MTDFVLDVLVGVFFVVACIGSLAMAVTGQETHDRFHRFFERSSMLFILTSVVSLMLGLGLVAAYSGQIARGEVSPLPWVAYEQEMLRHGVANGVLAFIWTLIYNLWTLWIPGHLFANAQKTKYGQRPIYPYIINVLVGVILSVKDNPVHQLLMFLPFGTGDRY